MLKTILLILIQIASAQTTAQGHEVFLAQSHKLFRESEIPLEIANVLPNPTGQDSNCEYVILKNTGDTELELDNYYLDDRENESSPFKLDGYSIPPLGEIILTSKETGISINNTSDEIRILDENLKPIITLEIKNAIENNTYSETSTSEIAPTISEIFPNPEGPDEGNEFITICNNTTSSINLSDYLLDDSKDGSDPHQMEGALYSTECKTITDNESEITLNNSEDSVRIINQEGNVISEISYENPEEDEIIYFNSSPSGTEEVSTSVIITEIFANPEEGETEWIEIKNTSQETISLNGLFLDDSEDGSKPYGMSGITLKPFEYKAIEKLESKLNLNNDSDSARIITTDGEEINSVSYEQTEKNLSYQLITTIDPITFETSEEWQLGEPTKNEANKIFYQLKTEIISYENTLLTTSNGKFETSDLSISDELKKTTFMPETKIELTYEIYDQKNKIISYKTENENSAQTTVEIGQAENSLYKKLLPYITTAIIATILIIYEYKKTDA